jgi:hypothetical protein
MFFRRETPPQEVNLIYREVGKTHVFTAAELRGFHIGSESLAFAYENLAQALSEHVSRVFGCEAKYCIEGSFDEFRHHLGSENLLGSFVIAKKAEQERLAAG